jgi:hypothetical protein
VLSSKGYAMWKLYGLHRLTEIHDNTSYHGVTNYGVRGSRQDGMPWVPLVKGAAIRLLVHWW